MTLAGTTDSDAPAPPCNTGAHPRTPLCPDSRFDWYRATVPVHPRMLMEACCELAGEGFSLEHGKGRFNYPYGSTVTVGGDRVATILHGGSNGHPNVEASGDRAPALAELLRANGPHRVTRCDVAVDVYGETLFHELEALGLRIAAEHGLSVRKVSSPLDKGAGETVYLGSRSSAVFARIYEKGKADRAVYGDVGDDRLNLWVRCELEVKPQKEMKAQAALMPPASFWGVSAWTAQLAEEAFAMAPNPIPFHPRRTQSDDLAWSWMQIQYRNLARRRCANKFGGDRTAMLAELEHAWFDQVDQENVA